MAITKRLVKGSALTHTELDSNFTDLDGRVTTLENTADSDSQTLTLAGDDLTITGGNTVSLSTLSTEVVDDTSPQLGGNLDLNGNEITGSGGSAISEVLNVLSLVGGNNGINLRTTTGAGKIVIGDQAGSVVLGNSANSVEFVNDVDVDFTNTNVDFTSATVTGLTVSQSIDSLTDVDTSTTPPGVGQVLKWDGAQWEPANDSSGSSGITLTALSVTQASAGTAGLVYNNITGVFTYTPPDLSTYLTSVPAQTFASLTDVNNANGPTTITIGKNAGTTNQGASSIALGGRAGETNQGINGIAIGQNAGKSDQGDRAIAIGRNAATTNQGNQSIVINATGGAVENITADSLVIKPIRNASGTHSMEYNPTTGEVTYDTLAGGGSVSWATLADKNNASGPTKIALGLDAGSVTQGNDAVAIGNEAGNSAQGTQAIALGSFAGLNNQGAQTVAVGMQSGEFYQGGGAVAVGLFGGGYIQGQQAVAIGLGAGENVQEPNSIAIGVAAGGGQKYQKTYVSHVGTNLELSDTAGLIVGAKISNTQGVTAGTEITAIVDSTNVTLNQGLTGTPAVSGLNFHQKGQGAESIAIGKDSGKTNQGTKAVAIGLGAGLTSQGAYGIALGENAGETNQGLNSVAIGTGAGETGQGSAAIAIGNGVAVNNQGESAIAIGNVAALAGQGDNAIAIGNRAGGFVNPQAATSIILNATGAQLENTTADSFVVKPVRNASGTHSMEYNPTTGEITYDTLASGGLPSRSPPIGATSSLADAAQADLDITGFKSYTLMAITTDKAARVRLYVNAATRTADAARAEGIDPTSDAGVIAEVITTGAETVIISPGAIGFNLESSPTTNIPCRVTNKSGSTGTVQVGLTILQLEA